MTPVPTQADALLADEHLYDALVEEVAALLTESVRGRVASVGGLTVATVGLPAPVGARCRITTRRDGQQDAEVVGLSAEQTLLSVFGDGAGIAPGDWVECVSGPPRVPVGFSLLGRVLDAQGTVLDRAAGHPPSRLPRRNPLHRAAPPALARRPIDAALGVGIRAIDALLPIGRGQRVGVFAGTGVGKSVLMGMICRHTQADVNVVALVGERGREVRDFLDKDLGPDGRARSVVVACTSDEPAALRVRACFHATAIAEFFRDQGLDVLLLVDSLTRMAMAQRQIGLAAGEPPTAKGYPPSTFAMLPRLLERAGRTQHGSITGIYTVLVEGDQIDEPLADAVRGVLDGHIWLSRKLANRGHFPAIDVLNSISRVAPDVTDAPQQQAMQRVRNVLAVWDDIEDLVSIGAYVPGANPEYDLAVKSRAAVTRFLQQPRDAHGTFAEHRAALLELAAGLGSERE